MRSLSAIVNWRRLLFGVPVLAVLAVALFWLMRESDATTSTPKAVLVDTPPVAGEDVGVQQGRVARDFIATTPDGSTVRLSELRGNPTLVNFWATWCTSCLAEMPDLRDVQAEFGAENLHVVAVNSGESATDAKKFVDFLDADDFVYALDPSLAVTDAYGVIGLSYSVFVDAKGIIRATYTGQLSKELMRQFATAAIEGAPAAEPPVVIRLPGTVESRSSVLLVEDLDERVVRFTSRRLRCDDSFCASDIVDKLAAFSGVTAIERALDADPPRIDVAYDGSITTEDVLANALAALIEDGGDPLYQQPVELR